MENHEQEVRRAFTFRPKFIQAADASIHIITKQFLEEKKFKNEKKLMYVGVHIRLRDANR